LAEGHAHLLGHLIGIEWKDSRHIRGILDDPKQIRNRAFHAAAQMFRRVSANDSSPVILQLEDLHWADGETLDFLNYLAEVDRDVPLLLLAFARPTLFERRTDWRSTEGIHQRIDLTPLDKRASRDLANELLKKLPEIPAALRELLTSSADGNPFYMEELTKMLIDQGAIQTGEPWKVNAERLLVTRVPPTLTSVLQARLDGLPANEKRALQQASVIGAVFWDQALAAVDEQAGEQLPALVQRELALPRADPPLDGLREYAFRHQILHQVTYDTVLKGHRRDWHAKVAQWLNGLIERGSLRAGDFLGLTAEHFEQAGDEANAAEFHARAAEQATGRLAHERVLTHVARALATLGEPRPVHFELRWRLVRVREQTLGLQARRDEQVAEIDALEELAEALDDDRRRAYAAWRRSHCAMRMADWAAQESAARHGLAFATRAGDDGLRLHALRLLASARVSQGDIEAGRGLALKGLAEARSLGLRAVESFLLNALMIAADMNGDLVIALDLNRQTLQIRREAGDRVNEAIDLLNLGDGWMKLGDLAQAWRELDAAMQMLRANGDRTMEGAALGLQSLLALWQENEAQALSLARSAVDNAVAAQARDMEVLAWLRLGDAELALGRLAAARQAFEQAHVRALEIESPSQDAASAGLARVALAEGDTLAALAAMQPVLDRASTSGVLDGAEFPRLIELTCHQVLTRSGDSRAADWLARAHTALITQADAIGDGTLRRGFLHNIPHHRSIVTAWAKCDAPAESPIKPTD
jgi:tetratricopeptide (TPR) repeat protein